MLTPRPFDNNSTAKRIISDMHTVHKYYGREKMLSDKDGFMNDFHFYIQNTANYLSGLEVWLEQRERGIARLDSYANAESIEDGSEYIYEFENYSIRLNSLYDRVLQFINAVFDTGISIEKVNHGIIASNTKLKIYPQVVEALKSVRKPIERYPQRRHTLVHKHSIREKTYMDITLHSNANIWKLIYGPKYRTFEKMAIEGLQNKSKKDTIEFSTLQKEIIVKLNELISLCGHQYEKQEQRLNSKTSSPPK